ncbi:glucose-fructose oxidoreductase domain-containing protein 1 [Folsomia candida]|uniref:glucose-fructose oxidoreductase domain-containing protein 1 n=1 Tax=Folsomia candida TaxID=158441 RepID=UPI000B904BA8|nr:glucose-fructose oxidoreductase domain-containing protein 1 [Folsomia candida]
MKKMLPGIGVFGTDPVVKILVPYLQAKGFRVEAIWSLTLHDAESAAKDLSIPFHTNKVDDLLMRKDVELVLILCPPNLHSQIAVKALGIGKHVMCDRPSGLSQCEALKMVLAQQYYPSLIGILNHSLRFHPGFIQMKRNVEKYVGQPTLCQCRIEMGPILGNHFNWMCDDVMGGGNVTLFGSHLIDLITYLTGQKAIRVHGVTKTLTQSTPFINGNTRRIASPDFSVIQMEMDGGMLVSLHLTNHLPKGHFTQEVLIIGSKGYLRAENGSIKGLLYNNNSNKDVGLEKENLLFEDTDPDTDLLLVDRNARNAIGNAVSSPLLPPIYMTGLLKLLSSLREAFNTPNGKEWKRESSVGLLGSGFEDGLYIQAVIEAIKRSSKECQWAKVSIITEEPDPNPVLTAAVRTSTISM